MKIFFSLLSVIIIYSLLSIHFVKEIFPKEEGRILGKSSSAGLEMSLSIGEYRFNLFGYSSPSALITFSGMGIFDQTYADEKGYFEFKNRFSPFSPREACLTARDQLGRLTAPVCLPPFPTRYDLSIGPVILPPTVSVNAQNYYQGDEVKLSGQTIPNSEVKFSVFAENREITRMIAQKNAESHRDGDTPPTPTSLMHKREDAFRDLVLRLFSLVKPVEAFSFPDLTTRTDAKGNFSLSLPSARPDTFRLFAQTSYEDGQSPESVKLNVKILPVWMVIIQFFLFIWSILKSRLLEILIVGELIGLTIFFLRRYLHPHAIARNRSIMLRESYALTRINAK